MLEKNPGPWPQPRPRPPALAPNKINKIPAHRRIGGNQQNHKIENNKIKMMKVMK